MKTFQDLASEAQMALNREFEILAEKGKVLDEKASILANQEAALLVRESEISSKERDIRARIEVLEFREAKIKREDQVAQEFAESASNRADAARMIKEASEKNDDTNMKLRELEKRELALSEREKNYRQEIKNEVVNGLLRIN